MKKDPLRRIYVQVGLVIGLLAIAFTFTLLFIELPKPEISTSMVILEYPELGISESVQDFANAVKASPDKQGIMLFMYTIWIIIVGAIAMAVHERKRRNF